MSINPASDSLPLGQVLGAANELVAAKLIEDWALGGALAAIYYVEPFTTNNCSSRLNSTKQCWKTFYFGIS
jgi:hypothetical protein